jgi:murein L,D-transpeptidase YcbB/YkuD
VLIVATLMWLAMVGDTAKSLIAADLAQLRSRGNLVVAGERICADRSVSTFYARRGNQPAWNTASTESLLRAIRRSAEDGFDPRDYHLTAIETLTGNDPQTIATRDLLASDAFLLLSLHLTKGRVNPQSLIREWCIASRHIDTAATLQAAIDAQDIEGMVDQLAPRHAGYDRLRAALQVYRDIERSGGWPLLSAGPPLRLGDRGVRVVELRRRLVREPIGIEPLAFPAIDTSRDVFEREVDATVRHFQGHHALTADGVVGRATWRALNVPTGERAEQIALNMERWRWMPERLGDSYVLVNIAAFRLELFENGRSILSMKTVVGKNFRETPFFPAEIREIVLNPSWYVPERIADEELWPKQRRDRSYFRREHIEVLRSGALRQSPGPWNPLGRIKFNMPNPFSVYLHDTPAKSLFSLESRAFSHGCIRIERPVDLALYLLRNQPDWNPTSLNAAIGTENEHVIRLARPEPVYVLYWTAWAADDGHVEFHRDVYSRDGQLAKALRQ